MKIKVIVEAVIDTEKIASSNTNVKYAIESTAFNKTNDKLTCAWAESEINNQGADKKITIELL